MTTYKMLSKVTNAVSEYLYSRGLSISEGYIECLLQDYPVSVMERAVDYAIENYGISVSEDQFARIVERVAIIG